MAITAKTVKLFRNTGLLPGNSMDSWDESLFDGFTVDPIITLQTRGLVNIRVDITYDNVVDIDYCTITGRISPSDDPYVSDTVCYWVTGIKMINENVCELALQCDYITTVGLANIEILSGWAIRRHVKYDVPFSNTLEEPFSPMEPLKLQYGGSIYPTGITQLNTYTDVVISNVDLMETEYTAESYKDAANDLIVTVPQVPVASVPTVFAISNFGDAYNMPMGSAYDYNNSQVKVGVQAVRSLGIESAIIDSYSIPNMYIQQKELASDGGRFGSLLGVNTGVMSSLFPEYSDDGYKPKNAKAWSGQFQRYILMSVASGDTQTYAVEDIVGLNRSIDGDPTSIVQWQIIADLLPTGSPMCRPYLYHGENVRETSLGNVRGQQWLKNPLRYNSPSGSLISDINFARQMQISAVGGFMSMVSNANLGGLYSKVSQFQNPYNTAMNNTDGFVASINYSTQNNKFKDMSAIINNNKLAVPTAMTALSTAANAAATAGMWYLNARDTAAKYWTGRNIVAPEINFAPITGTVNYIGNTFYDLRYMLSKADLIRFDNYLTQYGYAVSEPLTSECFTSRRYFNWVQATDVNVKLDGYGLDMILGVKNEIESGIRIWHIKPTAAAMTDNPILS